MYRSLLVVLPVLLMGCLGVDHGGHPSAELGAESESHRSTASRALVCAESIARAEPRPVDRGVWLLGVASAHGEVGERQRGWELTREALALVEGSLEDSQPDDEALLQEFQRSYVANLVALDARETAIAYVRRISDEEARRGTARFLFGTLWREGHLQEAISVAVEFALTARELRPLTPGAETDGTGWHAAVREIADPSVRYKLLAAAAELSKRRGDAAERRGLAREAMEAALAVEDPLWRKRNLADAIAFVADAGAWRAALDASPIWSAALCSGEGEVSQWCAVEAIAQSWRAIGVAAARDGDTGQARVTLTAAGALIVDDDPSELSFQADALARSGWPEEAEALLASIPDTVPDVGDVRDESWFGMVRHYSSENQMAAAESARERIAGEDLRRAADCAMARELAKKGREEAARAALGRCVGAFPGLTTRPGRSRAWVFLVQTCAALRDHHPLLCVLDAYADAGERIEAVGLASGEFEGQEDWSAVAELWSRAPAPSALPALDDEPTHPALGGDSLHLHLRVMEYATGGRLADAVSEYDRMPLADRRWRSGALAFLAYTVGTRPEMHILQPLPVLPAESCR